MKLFRPYWGHGVSANCLETSSGFSFGKQIEVFLIVLISVSPLLENSVKLPIMLVMILVRLFSFSRVYAPKEKWAILCILIVALAIPSVIDTSRSSPSNPYSILNAFFPVCIVFGMVFSSFYSMDELLSYVTNVVLVGAAFSLLGMFIIVFAPRLLSYFPTYTFGGFTHRTAFVFNILYADGYLVARNAGFAREPGVFQLLLNLSAFYVSQHVDKWSLLKLSLLGLALFFTSSTIGLIIYGFLLIRIIRDVPNAKYLIALLLVAFFSQFQEMVSYQLSNKLMGSDSFYLRLDPMLNCYKVGVQHIFGLGNTGYNGAYQDMGLGSFDSFSQILIRYGCFAFVILVGLYFNLLSEDPMLFLILVLTSFSQAIWFEPLIISMLFLPRNMNKRIDSNIGATEL